MKQLELELKERLLIVEIPECHQFNTYADKMTICNEINKPIALIYGKWEFICKGSELTEELSDKYVTDHEFYDENRGQSFHGYKDYKHNDYALQSALDSFISAIEAQGYYWGENPEDKMRHDPYTEAWQEAESRTFNPEKTLIFKIV